MNGNNMENFSVEECISQLQIHRCPELQLKKVIHILQRLTYLMTSSESRSDLKSGHWDIIAKIAENVSKIMLKNNHSDDELELFTVLLRFLRNSCGGCFENQDYVLNTAPVFNFAKEALQHFLYEKTPKETLILKISVQLFGNILLCNANSKSIIWSLFFEGNKFSYLFTCEDGIKDCTMMVLFNCISETNSECLFNTKEGHSILTFVADSYLKNQIKWTDSVMDALLDQDTLLSCYLDLPSSSRCVFLEMIYTHLDCEGDSNKVFNGSMENIKNLFLKNIINIMNAELKPFEITTLLSILCRASVKEPYMPMLQSSKDLLLACVESLKTIHILGKQRCSEFSTDVDSPYQGIKSDLIRLIGNLSYRCKENQDLIRNLDGIALVLDCCRLDTLNPYIKEWCILAIRNLLENNPENQAVVARISTHGDVIESEFLSDIGLQALKEDGKIRIRPTQPKS